MKTNRTLVVSYLLLVLSHGGLGQSASTLSIEDCYSLARENYPLVEHMALIEKSREFSVENAAKGYLPRISIGGQATYQSEVAGLPISIPNIDIPEVKKDQYRLFAEVTQPLTDAVIIKKQQQLLETQATIETQQVEVELYKLRERINQLFFSILLLDAQLEQTELLKKDIQVGLNKVNAAIRNGTAFRSSADILTAESLNVEQKAIEIKARRNSFAAMLSLFIQREINESTAFVAPQVNSPSLEISRPELTLLDLQQSGLALQNDLVDAKLTPRISAFVQGGYGRPTLNLFNPDFGFYYLGGIRLNWNLSNFYTSKNERQLVQVSKDKLSVQRKIFLFNTEIVQQQQNGEVSKLNQLIETDRDIIDLRTKIKLAASKQLENGVITSNDYLDNANAEDKAKQNLILHEIQLLIAQYDLKTTTGN